MMTEATMTEAGVTVGCWAADGARRMAGSMAGIMASWWAVMMVAWLDRWLSRWLAAGLHIELTGNAGWIARLLVA